MRGDLWSRLLARIGIVWEVDGGTNKQKRLRWFWIRSALHVFGGFIIGALTIWWVPVYAGASACLIAMVIVKESQEAQAGQWRMKTAFDLVFWVLGLLIPWVLKALT